MTAAPTSTHDDSGTQPGALGALRLVELEVGVLLRRARRAVVERAQSVHPDLQPVGYLVLAQVEADGPVRGSSLCGVLELDKAAVSRSVQHLLELGLVDRTPDPEDGRATLLSASDEGRRRIRDVDVDRRTALGERFAGWQEGDLMAVADSLHRYNATFDVEPDAS